MSQRIDEEAVGRAYDEWFTRGLRGVAMRYVFSRRGLWLLNTPFRKILEAAGCTLNDVVKSTVHLADIEDFDRYNATYKEFFKNVAVLPARTTVQSVLWNSIKVEIDVVARKPV